MTIQYWVLVAGGTGGWLLKGLLVIGLAFGLLYGSSLQVQADVGGPAAQSQRLELIFLKQLSNHRTGAADLSKMCARRATHKALRQACAQMRSVQLAELHKLQGWLREWHNLSYQAHPDSQARLVSRQLTKLRGQAFEQAWLQEMIRQQEAEIDLAQSCGSQSPERRALAYTCQDMSDRQIGELAQLRTWNCLWYGVCQKE